MKLTRKLLLEMIEEGTGSGKQYPEFETSGGGCLLYTSDAADE